MSVKPTLPEFAIAVKDIVDENFQDYKKPSMFIACVKCDFKCLKELNLSLDICQNMEIYRMPSKKIPIPEIFNRYKSNPITSAVVLGGLEPILQFEEILNLISYFRSNKCSDDFVIYTGYYPDEIKKEVQKLKEFDNIIIKYGRFIPDAKSKFDEVLGVTLSSENQFAVKIS